MRKRRKPGKPRKPPTGPSVATQVLPPALLTLPLAQLRVDGELAAALAGAGLVTVGDLLAAPDGDVPGAEALAAVNQALARVLDDGLLQFTSAATNDWPTLRAQLLGPLDDEARRLFGDLVGLDAPPLRRPAVAQRLGLTLTALDRRAEAIRRELQVHKPALLARLAAEIGREMQAFDGVLFPDHAAAGSLLHLMARAGSDAELGLRVAAFLLPRICHLHRGVLHGLPPRRFRELLRCLPRIVPHHRLPLPVDTILTELRHAGSDLPRGVLLHVLRTELHVAIELDSERGEVAAADVRGPAARLTELLVELGQPTALIDLTFAYRDRFRFATRGRLLRCLQGSPAFVRIGPETWSLRRWHEDEFRALAPVVDRVARKLAADRSRQAVVDLLGDGERAERTLFLVLDRLRDDPRVRLLGRGEACGAEHRQSKVMERLLRAFRRAGGEVVLGMFVGNQPGQQRRLVERLLHQNRAFVQPAPDRVDLLTNYPFNQDRLQRLVALVQDHLARRTGYASAVALKAIVDQTDLGGNWLTPQLLADVLRRHGRFEVLSAGLVALAGLGLAATLTRTTRQALRQLDEAVTIDDVLRARPELAEFADCLADLLCADPLVQTPDGVYFKLA